MQTPLVRLFLPTLALTVGMLTLSFPALPVQSTGQVDVRLLDQGQGKPKTVKAVGVIHAPIAKVWQALTNYGDYQKFMPRIASSRLDMRKGNLAQATLTLDVPWPFTGTWYTNRYVENPSVYSIRWNMLKGSIKHNEGAWQLKAQGNNTLAQYTVTADLGVPIIPQWMYGEVTKSTIPSIFTAVEKYASRL